MFPGKGKRRRRRTTTIWEKPVSDKARAIDQAASVKKRKEKEGDGCGTWRMYSMRGKAERQKENRQNCRLLLALLVWAWF